MSQATEGRHHPRSGTRRWRKASASMEPAELAEFRRRVEGACRKRRPKRAQGLACAISVALDKGIARLRATGYAEHEIRRAVEGLRLKFPGNMMAFSRALR